MSLIDTRADERSLRVSQVEKGVHFAYDFEINQDSEVASRGRSLQRPISSTMREHAAFGCSRVSSRVQTVKLDYS